jgi:hypothetical protein
MSTDHAAGVVARVQRVVAEQLAAVRDQVSAPLTPEQTRGLVFSRGDRVVDLLTGQTVEVVRGDRQAAYRDAARPF